MAAATSDMADVTSYKKRHDFAFNEKLMLTFSWERGRWVAFYNLL